MHGLEGVGAKRRSERFPAENAAAILWQYFDHVLDVPYTGRFRFADAGEFLEYYASTTNFKLAVRAGGTSRDSLLASAEEILRNHPLRSMSNDGTLESASRSPGGSSGDDQDVGSIAHPPGPADRCQWPSKNAHFGPMKIAYIGPVPAAIHDSSLLRAFSAALALEAVGQDTMAALVLETPTRPPQLPP